MSTHAMVGFIRAKTNQIKMIYVHFDGYLEGTGTALLTRFKHYKNARGLVYSGDVDSLQDSNRDFLQNHFVNVNSIKSAIEYCWKRRDISFIYLYSQQYKKWYFQRMDEDIAERETYTLYSLKEMLFDKQWVESPYPKRPT